MRVLLLVEGQSDRDGLPILARKIVPRDIGFDALHIPQGNLFSVDKVSAHVGYAVKRKLDTNKVVLCVDSEGIPIEETKTRIQNVASAVSRLRSGFPIKAVVVDHSLEGWLLWDRLAIARFLGLEESALHYKNPESEDRPADLMNKLFRQAGRDYIKMGNLPALAAKVDVGEIAKHSPTFREFHEAVSSI